MNPYIDTIMQHLSDSVRDFVVFFSNTLIGMIVSVYVMVSGEKMSSRLRRFLYAVLPIPTANRIIANLRTIDEKFGGFLLGKIIDHREMTSRFPAEFSHLLIRFKPVIIRIVKCISMSVMSYELIREMRNISNA